MFLVDYVKTQVFHRSTFVSLVLVFDIDAFFHLFKQL